MAGNIQANDAASLSFGVTNQADQNLFTAYGGNLSAPLARVMMTNTLWRAEGQSVVKSLELKGAQVSFSNVGAAGALTVDTLTANNSMFIINTNGKTADTVTVNQSLNGKNNSLVVPDGFCCQRSNFISPTGQRAESHGKRCVYVKPNHTTYGFPYLYTATEYGGNGEQQAMAVGGI
ncbi:hypothetical protein ACVXG8_04775 [Escherichia coli]